MSEADDRPKPTSAESVASTLAELLCALSFTTSLGLGDSMEHGVRTAYIAMRLADAPAFSADDREAVYYATLLKDTGCSACERVLAAFFPDQQVVNLDMMMTERTSLQTLMVLFTRYVPLDRALPARLVKYLAFAARGTQVMHEAEAGHCEVGELFARRLGFPLHVQQAVRFHWERWDGKADAYGMKGQDVPVAARIIHLAQMAEFAHAHGGRVAAEGLARDRAGSRFDPDLVSRFLEVSQEPGFWEGVEHPDIQRTVIDMAPPTAAANAMAGNVEALCEALADLVDWKSPATCEHSRTVGNLASGLARQLGLSPREQQRLRCAGLVHDLGAVSLPPGMMEREPRLSQTERERMRLHPYYTARVLKRVSQLHDLVDDAIAHHEQLDGMGYHRQLPAGQLSIGARILAVAERFAHLQLQGCDAAAAIDKIRTVAGIELDLSCCAALERVLGVGPEPPRRVRSPAFPHGLSQREAEVLNLLAEGMSNRQIAAELVISPKTVEHHVEHIFNKLGVTSRTAAVAYAVMSRATR